MSQPQSYQPGTEGRGIFTDLYDRISEKINDVANNRPDDGSSLADVFTMDNLRRTLNTDENDLSTVQYNDNARFGGMGEYNNNSRFGGNGGPYNDNPRFGGNGGSYNEGQTFMRGGQRCRIVCDPPRDQNNNLSQTARRLIGLSPRQARRIYENIRIVEINGRRLPTTQDYNRSRINVETRNDIIIRIDGIY